MQHPKARLRSRSRGDEALRGLERGLSVLVSLNQHGRLNVAEVARDTDLPRTTTLRILETLRRLGYISRDRDDRRYRLTIQVHQLADGYDDESWIAEVAQPHAEALMRVVGGWPVLLATPLGPSMVWRVNTDRQSSATLARFRVGMRVPLHRSASGLVFLAFSSVAQRRTTLDLLGATWIARQEEKEDRQALEAGLAEIRASGCAIYSRPSEQESAIAVPVLAGGRYLASLAMRYRCGAMRDREVKSRYLGALQCTAQSIATGFMTIAGRSWSGLHSREP